jgi:Uma2 family endonuclease
MEGVTVTEFITHPDYGQPWTVDDLDRLPDDELRYEIVDGSLLVSPAPRRRHTRVANLLRDLLSVQAAGGFKAVQDAGMTIRGRRTYFVPDISIVSLTALGKDGDDYFNQDEVFLAIEVLSPSNPGNDLVLKRHYYAAGGIRHYWIVDPDERTLTVLELDGDEYVEKVVVRAGEVFRTDEPFPVDLDLTDFL